MDPFTFCDTIDASATLCAQIPVRIADEGVLIEALSRELRFPDYFGNNWNAVDECICDLCWLPPGDVILFHRDLPLASHPVVLSLYLSVLCNAVTNWATKGSNFFYISSMKVDAAQRQLLGSRRLRVVFPSHTRSTVISLLAARGL